MKKPPVLKTTEELLDDLNNEEIADSKETIILKDEDDPILAFLRFYNIQPGKKSIRKKYLYTLYKKFDRHEIPVSYTKFCTILNEYFEHTQLSARINKTALKLADEVLKEVKKLHSKKDITTKPNFRSHFEAWLNFYNLTPKTRENNWIWVSSILLYNLYDKWIYFHTDRKKPMLFEFQFRKMLKAYKFEYKFAGKKGSFYKIDNSICQHITSDMRSGKLARNSLTNEKETKEPKE